MRSRRLEKQWCPTPVLLESVEGQRYPGFLQGPVVQCGLNTYTWVQAVCGTTYSRYSMHQKAMKMTQKAHKM